MALVQKDFSDLITFTRASGGGRFNASGQYEWLPADQPRIDFDPATGECLGLLIEEQRTNQAIYSTHYGYGPGWVVSNCNLVSRAVVAPDGKAMAAYVAPTGGSLSYIGRTSTQLAANTTYTLSIYAKADKARTLTFEFLTSNWVLGGSGGKGEFNTLDMTTTSTDAKVEPVGNGWYRLSVTRTTTATPASTIVMYIDFFGSGIAGNGLHLWGLQVEQGAFATSPIPTPATFTGRASTGTYFDANGVLKMAAAGEARYTHAYIDGQWVSAGLLLEGQSTNLLTESEFRNGINDAPSRSGNVSAGVFAGLPSGTGLAFGVDAVNSYAYKTFSGNVGTAYTFSAFVRMDDENAPNPGEGTTQDPTKDFVLVADAQAGSDHVVTDLGGGLYRVSYTKTNASGNTAYGVIKYPGHSARTFKVTGYMLEVGSQPTSYIPTTTAQVTRAADTSTSSAVTRAADVASVNVLSPWYNAAEGTLFVEATSNGTGSVGSASFVTFGDGSTTGATNRIQLDQLSNGRLRAYISDSSGIPATLPSSEGTHGVTSKLATAFRQDSFAFSANGSAAVVDTSGAMPSPTRMGVGSTPGVGNQSLNGHLRSIRYFPRRLSNSELQALTAN